jgi:hypothetical protein
MLHNTHTTQLAEDLMQVDIMVLDCRITWRALKHQAHQPYAHEILPMQRRFLAH